MERTDYEFDVFISHAVEDKLPIANELLERLKEKGLNVWYSGTELGVGDRLTESIHRNLDMCRFGVVILSPTYITKIWALNEFFFLLTREKNGEKVILPVLYDITPEELGARFPLMADIFAVRADKGLDRVAEILTKEIRKHQAIERKRKNAIVDFFRAKRWVTFLLMMLIAVGGYSFFQFYQVKPGTEIIEQAIQKRIAELQQSSDIDLKQILQLNNGKRVSTDEINKAYTDFTSAKSYYRNEYTLSTGFETIRSKKNIEAALAMHMDGISPLNAFALSSPDLYRCDSISSAKAREEKYVFKNTQAVTYSIVTSETKDEAYQVEVSYANAMRLVVVHFVFPASATDTKRYQVIITALRPSETYTFTQHDDAWMLSTIK